MTAYETLAVSIVGSLIAAALWVVYFARKVEQIRDRLRTRKEGWTRKRYVRAFVGAVRGQAVAMDTHMLSSLYLWSLIGFSLLLVASALYVEREYEQAGSDIAELIERLAREKTGVPKDPQARIETLLLEAEEVAKRHRRLGSSLRPSLLAIRIAGITLLVGGLVAVFLWLPFLVMRRAFAYELDRFMLRIQGLASTAELAQIAVAESQVWDEPSLRKFVALIKGVAERHSVPELVQTFDLWESASDQC